jgi:hypothetical protein
MNPSMEQHVVPDDANVNCPGNHAGEVIEFS